MLEQFSRISGFDSLVPLNLLEDIFSSKDKSTASLSEMTTCQSIAYSYVHRNVFGRKEESSCLQYWPYLRFQLVFSTDPVSQPNVI